jgi:SET domain/Bromodomain/PHD-like zinc-binding domain/PHD-finger/F/Y-rich N-terminus/PWWP domain
MAAKSTSLAITARIKAAAVIGAVFEIDFARDDEWTSAICVDAVYNSLEGKLQFLVQQKTGVCTWLDAEFMENRSATSYMICSRIVWTKVAGFPFWPSKQMLLSSACEKSNIQREKNQTLFEFFSPEEDFTFTNVLDCKNIEDDEIETSVSESDRDEIQKALVEAIQKKQELLKLRDNWTGSLNRQTFLHSPIVIDAIDASPDGEISSIYAKTCLSGKRSQLKKSSPSIAHAPDAPDENVDLLSFGPLNLHSIFKLSESEIKEKDLVSLDDVSPLTAPEYIGSWVAIWSHVYYKHDGSSSSSDHSSVNAEPNKFRRCVEYSSRLEAHAEEILHGRIAKEHKNQKTDSFDKYLPETLFESLPREKFDQKSYMEALQSSINLASIDMKTKASSSSLSSDLSLCPPTSFGRWIVGWIARYDPAKKRHLIVYDTPQTINDSDISRLHEIDKLLSELNSDVVEGTSMSRVITKEWIHLEKSGAVLIPGIQSPLNQSLVGVSHLESGKIYRCGVCLHTATSRNPLLLCSSCDYAHHNSCLSPPFVMSTQSIFPRNKIEEILGHAPSEEEISLLNLSLKDSTEVQPHIFQSEWRCDHCVACDSCHNMGNVRNNHSQVVLNAQYRGWFIPATFNQRMREFVSKKRRFIEDDVRIKTSDPGWSLHEYIPVAGTHIFDSRTRAYVKAKEIAEVKEREYRQLLAQGVVDPSIPPPEVPKNPEGFGLRDPGAWVTMIVCKDCSLRLAEDKFCPVCHGVWHDSEHLMISCDECSSWIHCRCDGLVLEDLQLIDSQKHPAWGNRSYSCPVCRHQTLETLIGRLKNEDKHQLFFLPVTEESAPGYHNVIEHPIDLLTMAVNLDSGVYDLPGTEGLELFRSHWELIIRNALVFNTPSDLPYQEAWRMLVAGQEIFSKTLPMTHDGSYRGELLEFRKMVKDTKIAALIGPIPPEDHELRLPLPSLHIKPKIELFDEVQSNNIPEIEVSVPEIQITLDDNTSKDSPSSRPISPSNASLMASRLTSLNTNISRESLHDELPLEYQPQLFLHPLPFGKPCIPYHEQIVDINVAICFSVTDVCAYCGSAGDSILMLSCIDCGEVFHAYCVAPTLYKRILEFSDGDASLLQFIISSINHRWRCNDCKICEICGECSASEENHLLYCDSCDLGYHAYCVSPIVHPISASEEWFCGRCLLPCTSSNCSSRMTASVTSWSNNREKCLPCSSRDSMIHVQSIHDLMVNNSCPGCNNQDTELDMIQCDKCSRWTHYSCDSAVLTPEFISLLNSNKVVSKYSCLACKNPPISDRSSSKSDVRSRIKFQMKKKSSESSYFLNGAIVVDALHPSMKFFEKRNVVIVEDATPSSASLSTPTTSHTLTSDDTIQSSNTKRRRVNNNANNSAMVSDSHASLGSSNSFKRLPPCLVPEIPTFLASLQSQLKLPLIITNSKNSIPSLNSLAFILPDLRQCHFCGQQGDFLCGITTMKFVPSMFPRGIEGRLLPVSLSKANADSSPNTTFAHLMCAMWSSECFIDSETCYMHEIQRAIRRAVRTHCSYCGYLGATLGCSEKSCTQYFHFRCAIMADSSLNPSNRVVYCVEHSHSAGDDKKRKYRRLDSKGKFEPFPSYERLVERYALSPEMFSFMSIIGPHRAYKVALEIANNSSSNADLSPKLILPFSGNVSLSSSRTLSLQNDFSLDISKLAPAAYGPNVIDQGFANDYVKSHPVSSSNIISNDDIDKLLLHHSTNFESVWDHSESNYPVLRVGSLTVLRWGRLVTRRQGYNDESFLIPVGFRSRRIWWGPVVEVKNGGELVVHQSVVGRVSYTCEVLDLFQSIDDMNGDNDPKQLGPVYRIQCDCFPNLKVYGKTPEEAFLLLRIKLVKMIGRSNETIPLLSRFEWYSFFGYSDFFLPHDDLSRVKIPRRQFAESTAYGSNAVVWFGLGVSAVQQYLESLPEAPLCSIIPKGSLNHWKRYLFRYRLPNSQMWADARRKRDNFESFNNSRSTFETNTIVSSRYRLYNPHDRNNDIKATTILSYHPETLDSEDLRYVDRVSMGDVLREFEGKKESSSFDVLSETDIGFESNLLSSTSSTSAVSSVRDEQFAVYKRLLSKGDLSSLVVARRSPIHGWGLFLKVDVPKDAVLIEYTGELISNPEADIRELLYEELARLSSHRDGLRHVGESNGSKATSKVQYLDPDPDDIDMLTILGLPNVNSSSDGSGSCYLFRFNDEYIVDATMKGSAARFINHCCEPNCYSKVVIDGKSRHILIRSLRPLRRGEELTYNYRFGMETDPSQKLPCYCGAPSCTQSMN